MSLRGEERKNEQKKKLHLKINSIIVDYEIRELGKGNLDGEKTILNRAKLWWLETEYTCKGAKSKGKSIKR